MDRWIFGLTFAFGLILGASAQADVSCKDVKYGSDFYSDKMDELASGSSLPGDNYNRYHEDVVSALCNNSKDAKKIIEEMIDRGDVKRSEVEAIKEVLGKDGRSESGKRYGYSKARFEEMGLCSACADNVAQYYTHTPESKWSYGQIWCSVG